MAQGRQKHRTQAEGYLLSSPKLLANLPARIAENMLAYIPISFTTGIDHLITICTVSFSIERHRKAAALLFPAQLCNARMTLD